MEIFHNNLVTFMTSERKDKLQMREECTLDE